jgi:hypothetical protein
MMRSYMICTPDTISCGDQIGKIKWEGQVAVGNERRGAFRILVKKPEIKRTLGKHRREWVDNIKVDL